MAYGDSGDSMVTLPALDGLLSPFVSTAITE
jgi:hypothetical protein